MSSTALALWILAGSTPHQEESPWATAPVLVVLLDDVGRDLLGRAETPTIDALAERSAVLEQAWSYPSCSPARAALLTGRYGFRTGIGSVLRMGDREETCLSLEERTLAEVLPERVDAFGKWHVSYGADDPNLQGFAHYAGCLGNLGSKRGYYDWRRVVDGKRRRESRYATDVTTDDALASDAPIRYVAYHAVHEPWESPPGGVAETPLGRALEMLTHLDGQLARLLEGYEGYVFLISDNGTPQPLGGEKGRLTEGGVNVLFMVAGPGVVPGERQDLVNVVDVLPTLVEMRGLDSVECDGVSFLPVLRGEPGRRRFNYVERFSPNGAPEDREWALRDATHKIVARHRNRLGPEALPLRIELYRLPGEVPVPAPLGPEDRERFERLLAADPFEGG